MSRDGGPAFPYGDSINDGDVGMSLRDWYAGLAMQGALSNRAFCDGGIDLFLVSQCRNSSFDALAQAAYNMADAMIKERNSDAQENP